MAMMTCSYCRKAMRICNSCGKVYCASCSYKGPDKFRKERICPDCGSSNVKLADDNVTGIKMKMGRAHY